jgi:hypothetical protein
MVKVVLDQAGQAKLDHLTEEAEVVRADGQSLGRYVPHGSLPRPRPVPAELCLPTSREELERRRKEYRRGLPLAEVLKAMALQGIKVTPP